MNVTRKQFLGGSLFASIMTVLKANPAWAQFTEQEVRNGAQITATGDVVLDQAASGSQTVFILDDGTAVTGDGVYRTATSQTVVNDGQVTSTGDVRVSQSASGDQTVTALYSGYPETSGQPAESCMPGAVMANPYTGQLFYQREDCCWYPACAAECKKCRTCAGS